jgi:hypothetical protein
MPQSNEGILLFVGAIFFLIGILGGGFEISAIKIPSVGMYIRVVSGVIGIIFMGVALRLYIFPLIPPQQNIIPIVSFTPTTIAVLPPTATTENGETSAPGISSAPPSQIPAGTVLFQENFEDDKPLPFSYVENGDWKQVSDETGNHVYEIDNQTGYPQIRFGSDLWKNYGFEFRTRILDLTSSDSLVFCIVRLQGSQYYQLDINDQSIMLGTEPPFQALGDKWISIGKGIWFSIRMEAQGTQIRVFLDNNLIIDITDSHVSQGSMTLGVAPGTYAQFDDIRVISLGE